MENFVCKIKPKHCIGYLDDGFCFICSADGEGYYKAVRG
jgi:hypothetical protein